MKSFESPSEDVVMNRREFLRAGAVGALGLTGGLLLGDVRGARAFVAELLEREKEPKEKVRVTVDVFYSAHRTRKDIEKLPERLKGADIFIPEGFGWTEEWENAFNAVSRGEKTPKEALQELDWSEEDNSYELVLAELQMLHGTGKSVVFADFHQDDPLAERHRKESAVSISILGKPEEIFGSVRSSIQRFVTIQKEREAHILGELKELVRSIRKGGLSFGKDEVKILLQLGSYHTAIMHQLGDAGEEVTAMLMYHPGTPSFEGAKKYLRGETVDDELAARIFLEYILNEYYADIIKKHLYKITDDTIKVQEFLNGIIVQFKLDEIKEMIKSAQGSPHPIAELGLGLSRRGAAKGIRFPKTAAELDEMLRTIEVQPQ